MVAGLPGTGIGGCFFLLTALLMPFVELGRTLTGRSSWRRWGFVLQQTAIALGVVATMWATGWLIGQALYWALRLKVTRSAAVVAALQPQNFLQTPPVVITLATLVTVLLSIEALRWKYGRRDVRAAVANASRPRKIVS